MQAAQNRYTPCKAGELVIYPAAPDTAKTGANFEMTLRRMGQPDSAGRIVLSQGGTAYTMVDGSKAPGVAELRSGLYAPNFEMCPS